MVKVVEKLQLMLLNPSKQIITRLSAATGGLFLALLLLSPSSAMAAQYGYNIASGNLTAAKTGGCTAAATYDGQLATNVYLLACPSNEWSGNYAQTQTVNSYISAPITNRSYRICAFIKGVGSNVQLYFVRGSQYASSYANVFNNANYGYFCSGWAYVNTVGPLNGYVTVDAGDWIYVSGMVLESTP